MNTNQYEKMTKARDIALNIAKIILEEAGISKNDKYYSIRLYEMQFAIYHELKLCLDKMTKARDIALNIAKIILEEDGISKNDKYYSIRLYEMQFAIYHELKLCLDILTENE
jgi:hypothetical protein